MQKKKNYILKLLNVNKKKNIIREYIYFCSIRQIDAFKNAKIKNTFDYKLRASSDVPYNILFKF